MFPLSLVKNVWTSVLSVTLVFFPFFISFPHLCLLCNQYWRHDLIYWPLKIFVFFSVGVFKGGRVEIIANDQGNRITPSYVAFTAEGERLIGDAAKNQLTSNPENTVFDAKRLIGRNWDDPAVQKDIKYLPFKVIEYKFLDLI